MWRYLTLILFLLGLASCGHPSTDRLPAPVAGSLLHLARALPTGDLAGIAIDSTTGLPIEAALVEVTDSLSSTRAGTVTDSLGVFVLSGLSSGRKLLTIRFIGYCPKRLTVTLPPPPGFALIAEVPQAHCKSQPGSDMISCAPCA